MRSPAAITCCLLAATGCGRRPVDCPRPTDGHSIVALDGACLDLDATFASEQSDPAEPHVVRVLSMRGCEQWAAFSNEHKLTNNVRCMGTECDVVAANGLASGQAVLGGDRRWSGDQDEEVIFSSVDGSALSGESRLANGVEWDFRAGRLAWAPKDPIDPSDNAPLALASRALWCDACPPGSPASCGGPWPSCIADVCARSDQ